MISLDYSLSLLIVSIVYSFPVLDVSEYYG